MILCVDIGNTSIKMARVDSARRVRNLRVVPSTVAAREISRAVALAGRGGVARAAIASVRPKSTDSVVRAIRGELGIDAFVITHRASLPIQVATRRPARVGVDRICAACGAVSGRRRNAIIVDAGSAITVDLVIDRRFVGGLIMPGPQLMLGALHQFTAQLPALDIDRSGAGSIDDTVPAMLTGALVGSAGAILAAVLVLERRAGRALPVFLTGGHASRLSPSLPATWIRSPHLTLQGIATVAAHRKSGL
jgi:type III pantothenate kinase